MSPKAGAKVKSQAPTPQLAVYPAVGLSPSKAVGPIASGLLAAAVSRTSIAVTLVLLCCFPQAWLYWILTKG